MNRTLKLILIYTLLFGILCIGVFLQFILMHKSFIQYGDGFRQGYFWLAENKFNLDAFLSGNGVTSWSWSKGLGMDTSFITDPFTVLAAAFKPGYLELGYTVALVAQLYFCGLAFLAFAREVAMKDLQCILGAICYAFCGWGIGVALVQYSFVLKMMLFPILILSVDRIYKGKSPILFILTVAYYTLTGVYFAYMAAFGVIIYILVRYFYYNTGSKASAYFISLGKFILYGIAGIILAAVTALPYISSLMSSTTESATDGYGLFYTAGHYLGFGTNLLSQTVTGEFLGGYSYFGLSAIVLMTVPVAFRKFSLRSTPAIMTIIVGVMLIFPFFSSALNGFSYCSNRWFFMAMFFVLWAGLDAFEPEKLAETRNIVLMMISLAVMFIWTIGFQQLGIIYTGGNDENLFIMLNLFSGVLTVMIIAISFRKGRTGWKNVCIVAVCAMATIGCWNIAFKGNIGNFVKNNEINKQLEHSTQRVATQIDDDGFYRVDQVNGVRYNRLMTKPANENLWWQSRSLYIYDSKIPADMIRLNGLVGNNYGFSERVYMLSNDNRMGLDFLMGVKYFLGNDPKELHFTPDKYAGYGFRESGKIDDVTIWKNKYDSGLGFGYDACISESEFLKLNRLQREQALLQAAVVPDDEIGSLTGCRQIKAENIETAVSRHEVTVKGSDQISISDGMITAAEDDSVFTIIPKEPMTGQNVITFEGLERLNSDGTGGNYFRIYIADSVKEKSNIRKNNNQTLADVDHYDINLGYGRDYEDTLTVRLTKAGQYRFDDIYMSSMSASLYDKYAAQRVKSVFDISSFDNREVAGTVDMPKDGILFLSIYDYDNWDVYVDGRKTEKIEKVNIAFTGVEISHGQHEVVLKYNFRMVKIGLAISLFGLLLTVLICIVHRRMKKGVSDSEA